MSCAVSRGTSSGGQCPIFVIAVNGVDPYAMERTMGRYLDDLLCRQ